MIARFSTEAKETSDEYCCICKGCKEDVGVAVTSDLAGETGLLSPVCARHSQNSIQKVHNDCLMRNGFAGKSKEPTVFLQNASVIPSVKCIINVRVNSKRRIFCKNTSQSSSLSWSVIWESESLDNIIRGTCGMRDEMRAGGIVIRCIKALGTCFGAYHESPHPRRRKKDTIRFQHKSIQVITSINYTCHSSYFHA